MNVWILYDAARLAVNRRFAELLQAAFSRRQVASEVVVAESAADLADRPLPELVVMRSVNPPLSDYFESKGTRVWNDSRVARICNDKWETFQTLGRAGITSLPSRLVTRTEMDRDEFDFPGVIKSRNGHGGTEVFWVRNRAELIHAFEKIGKPSAVWQFPASDLGKDLRVYVLGKKILVGMLRESADDFRSNFCLGGRASVYPISTEVERQVRDIADLFHFGLVGIDFVFHHGRPVFNEIEDVVGCRMVYAETDRDMADLYAEFLLARR